MATISRFEDLEVWKMAREQANEVYNLYTKGDFAKDYKLREQLNASSGSAMDNIAEGFERWSNKEFSQFLVIAKGSNAEVRSQLYRAFDRGHIMPEVLSIRIEYSELLGKKIKTLIDYLHSSKYKRKPPPK